MRMMIRLLSAAAVALLALSGPTWALESAPATSPRAIATLVSDRDAISPGGELRLGLRLRIAPGWHSYWQNPGDAGVPTELTLTLPAGQPGPIIWPTPEIAHEGPLVTYGFTGEVLLPARVTNAGPGHITAAASWLVCRDICVPEDAEFSLDLPAGTAPPAREAALFAAADQRTPRPSPFTAEIGPDSVLRITGLPDSAIRDAIFVPDQPGLIRNDTPQPLRQSGATITLGLTRADHPKDAPLSGVLLLTDASGQASALSLTATQVTTNAAIAAPGGWAAILGLGVLGGLILNLMPCVFPVLAMKAIGFARLAGAHRRQVRGEALSYTAGVLVSFAALGGILLALGAAGSSAGWGFQFSSPAIVATMAWILFAVGLNLSGALEIGGRLAGIGSSLASRGGHAGSFFTGLLAVLVATPCTAPFMGAALAAAATAPPALAMAAFLSIGLGLAAPTLLFAIVPGLANHLPRPGAWMDILRQALAFPMYAAVIWLVWVISQQSGPSGVLLALAGMLLIGAIAWLLSLERRTGRVLAGGTGIAMIALLGVIAVQPPPTGNAGLAQAEGAEAFTTDRLAALRAANRPVFVNLTAAWCVTCMVNERVALDRPAVRAAFAAGNIAYLLGDWTNQDRAITNFLRAQGRDGVPLYLFYPAGAAAPVNLPQILTEHEVLSVLGAS